MLESLILGFLLGASVPIIARRFGKFIPTDPGETICRLIHKPRFPKSVSPMWAKQIGDTYYYVEEVRMKNKSLAFKSLRKRQPKSPS